MSVIRMSLMLAGILALAVSPTFATTITLTFDASDACALPPCTINELIDQTYGDVAGLVDVTYTGRSGPGNSQVTSSSLFFWNTGYAGLTDVVFTNATRTAEIAFAPVIPGTLMTLNSLDLGNFDGSGGPTILRVFDGAYHPLATIPAISVPVDLPFHLSALNISSTNGLIVQFGPDAFNIGLDNLNLTLEAPAPTPEPGSLLLLCAGAAALALRRRKR